jgi:outer membrane biosynthesis protein TonB
VYTNGALRHGVKGSVQLRVHVDADGSVSKIEPVKMLPYGLTDEAMKSERRIEFYPAMSSRNFMVPADITVEYSFP